MKNKILTGFIILGIIFATGLFLFRNYRAVNINGKYFLAKTALTSKEQEKGLGGKNNLCQRCAMLFVFPRAGKYPFWMKDMNFNLDIIWITGGRVAYVAENVSKESLDIINPNVNANMVLEIKSGLSRKYGFEIGDELKIY